MVFLGRCPGLAGEGELVTKSGVLQQDDRPSIIILLRALEFEWYDRYESIDSHIAFTFDRDTTAGP